MKKSARSNKRDFKRALGDYDRCLALDPCFVKALFNRGLVRLQLGDDDKARADFDRAIACDPSFDPALTARDKLKEERRIR